MSDQRPDQRPGKGLFGWFGRQIGYVRKAIKTDVAGPQKIYRNETVEEQSHPTEPNVKLRRTTIDEAIIEPRSSSPAPQRTDRDERSPENH
jgi:hypothetical protein